MAYLHIMSCPPLPAGSWQMADGWQYRLRHLVAGAVLRVGHNSGRVGTNLSRPIDRLPNSLGMCQLYDWIEISTHFSNRIAIFSAKQKIVYWT